MKIKRKSRGSPDLRKIISRTNARKSGAFGSDVASGFAYVRALNAALARLEAQIDAEARGVADDKVLEQ